MWVRGMTRAGHSGCQGGLSPVQTQRGNDSCAQIAVIARLSTERVEPIPNSPFEYWLGRPPFASLSLNI